MLSAAMLLGPACGSAPTRDAPTRDEPLRRAGFRSLAARELVASCPGSAGRFDFAYQASRHDELKQLAARTGAGTALSLGENEWAGVSRVARPEPCGPGEVAYSEGLVAYRAALDTLAARIADHPAQQERRP